MSRNGGVTLPPHCVGRFHERFRPALDQIMARRELEMLLEADSYVIVGTDLVLSLSELAQCPRQRSTTFG